MPPRSWPHQAYLCITTLKQSRAAKRRIPVCIADIANRFRSYSKQYIKLVIKIKIVNILSHIMLGLMGWNNTEKKVLLYQQSHFLK